MQAACARVGMSRTSAYLLRRRDAGFAQGWQAALVLARRHVEEVLATRALDGVDEAVWFHGEKVGVRRRFDARLLLAHLARLDKAAEASGGEEGGDALALRFDETLALIAGEDAAEDLPEMALDDEALERARLARGMHGGHAGTDAPPHPLPHPLPLPPARADYVHASAEPRWIAANEAWLDTAEAIDRAFEEEHGIAPDDLFDGVGARDELGEEGEERDWRLEVDAPVYPPAPDYGDFHAASAARWDAWQARAFAAVDTALLADIPGEEGEMEFKSCAPPPGRATVFFQDRVNRVNLPTPAPAPDGPRPWSRMRLVGVDARVSQCACRCGPDSGGDLNSAGNRSAIARLSGVKAGAALPPTPSRPASADIFPENRSGRSGLVPTDSRKTLARKNGELDHAAARAANADLVGGGIGQVDHAVGVERSAIVDGDHDRGAGDRVGHAHLRAEGQRAVRGGERVGIEALPARGAGARETAAVIARHARADGIEAGLDRGKRGGVGSKGGGDGSRRIERGILAHRNMDHPGICMDGAGQRPDQLQGHGCGEGSQAAG